MLLLKFKIPVNKIVDYVYYETNELEPVYEESTVPYRGCELQMVLKLYLYNKSSKRMGFNR